MPSYCLLFWKPDKKGDNGETSIKNLSFVPKKDRVEGAQTKLKWTFANGTSKRCDAIVVKISDDIDELECINLNAITGKVVEPSSKAFTSTVIAKRRQLLVDASLLSAAKASASKRADKKMLAHYSKSSPAITFRSGNKQSGLSSPKPSKSACSTETSSGSMSFASAIPSAGREMPAFITGVQKGDGEAIIVKDKSGPAVEGVTHDSSGVLISDVNEIICSIKDGIIPYVTNDARDFLQAVCEGLDRLSLPPSFCSAKPLLEGLHNFLASYITVQEEEGVKRPAFIKLPDEYFIGGHDKVELYPGQGFFFRKVDLDRLLLRAVDPDDWKCITSNVLREVYRDQLKWLTAVGSASKPGVNKKVHNALYCLCKDRCGGELELTAFHAYINKLTNNKRGSTQRKLTQRSKKRKIGEAPEDIHGTTDTATEEQPPDDAVGADEVQNEIPQQDLQSATPQGHLLTAESTDSVEKVSHHHVSQADDTVCEVSASPCQNTHKRDDLLTESRQDVTPQRSVKMPQRNALASVENLDSSSKEVEGSQEKLWPDSNEHPNSWDTGIDCVTPSAHPTLPSWQQTSRGAYYNNMYSEHGNTYNNPFPSYAPGLYNQPNPEQTTGFLQALRVLSQIPPSNLESFLASVSSPPQNFHTLQSPPNHHSSLTSPGSLTQSNFESPFRYLPGFQYGNTD